MTGRNDIAKILDGWLEEGPTQMTDRTLDSALDVIDHTPQRRVWRLPWPVRAMTLPDRIAVAALVAVVAVGGLVLLQSATTNVGQPSESTSNSPAEPTPTSAAPSLTRPPDATAPIAGTVLARGQMALAAGTTYSTLDFAPAFTIRGAASWWLMGDGPGHVWFNNGPNEPNPPDQYSLGMVVAADVLPQGGGSAIAVPADLLAWLQARSDLALGPPHAVSVGGLRGTVVVGTVRKGAQTNSGGAINIICSADSSCLQETGNEIGVAPGRAFEIIVMSVRQQTLVIEADGVSPIWAGNAGAIDSFLAGLSFPGVSN